MFDLFVSFTPGTLAVLGAVLFVAAYVRGFAGFGAGMIFMPVATALVYPPTAAAGFLVLDSVIAAPLVVAALRICDWSTIIPATISAVIFVQLGSWFMATTDVLILRWVIFCIVAGLLLLLVSGWKYRGKPTRPISFGVGAVAGTLGGISQVSGPPVIAFWLSSAREPAIVRANLIVFFALSSIGTFVAYLIQGFFTLDVLRLLIPGIPVYALGLFFGSRWFGSANPKYYRWIAYSLIAIAALTSMPLLDEILR